MLVILKKYLMPRIVSRRCYHIPFVDLYQKTTGIKLSKDSISKLIRKDPSIKNLTRDDLQYTLNVLTKFNINAVDACHNHHIFCMNPIRVDNYGQVLKECCFTQILPMHIIRYHTIVRSKTITDLKKSGLIRSDVNLEEIICNSIHDWPTKEEGLHKFQDSDTSILTVRKSVLRRYLKWRLGVTDEEFVKYCNIYRPLKHIPMSDMQEALHIAENIIKFDVNCIRRNGFLLCMDPVKTKLIIDKVKSLGGVDIVEAIRMIPAILKNDCNSLLQIKTLFEEYGIPEEFQRKCLNVFCLSPKTISQRLMEIKRLEEYEAFFTNPRLLSLVLYKQRSVNRLNKFQELNKSCFSLNSLVCSKDEFKFYYTKFGYKTCGRDIAIAISSSLDLNIKNRSTGEYFTRSQLEKIVLNEMKRHKYWLHTPLNVIYRNVKLLKNHVHTEAILENCLLLLYPTSLITEILDYFLNLREGRNIDITLDITCSNLNFTKLSDSQILSLISYEIENKYHFSGDGVWAVTEDKNTDTKVVMQ